MINNINIIKPLLTFNSEDEFYFCLIIKRKKEHPELGSNNYVIKSYYIKSLTDLEKDYDEMKHLAAYHNARVMINLNKRSFERIAFHTLKKVADQIMNKDYKSVRRAFNTVCGQFAADNNKTWIVDIDEKSQEKLKLMSNFINGLQPVKDKIQAILPTKNGYHLITTPFNVQEFRKNFTEDIHKNNPTVLYIP